MGDLQRRAALLAEAVREATEPLMARKSRVGFDRVLKRFARADRGSEMTRPLSLRLPRGGRIIITGESFAPGGGVEAAWLAGNACARRLIEED